MNSTTNYSEKFSELHGKVVVKLDSHARLALAKYTNDFPRSGKQFADLMAWLDDAFMEKYNAGAFAIAMFGKWLISDFEERQDEVDCLVLGYLSDRELI